MKHILIVEDDRAIARIEKDYLELGGEARMNFPGTLSQNNWSWRAQPGFATAQLAEKICQIAKRYGRK